MLEALLLRFAHLDRTIDLERLIRAAAGGAPADAGGAAAPPPPAPPGGGGARSPGARAPKGGASSALPARPARGPGAATASSTGAVPEASASGGVATVTRTDRRPADLGTTAPAPVQSAPATAPRSDAASDVAAVRAALREMVETRDGIPSGTAIPMRAADVAEAGAGRVVLRVPAVVLERFQAPGAMASLERAFSARLGRETQVELTAEAGGRGDAAPERLTPEKARSDTLDRMTREEPGLRRAVEEWDLELLN
jgi:hypothetical protein